MSGSAAGVVADIRPEPGQRVGDGAVAGHQFAQSPEPLHRRHQRRVPDQQFGDITLTRQTHQHIRMVHQHTQQTSGDRSLRSHPRIARQERRTSSKLLGRQRHSTRTRRRTRLRGPGPGSGQHPDDLSTQLVRTPLPGLAATLLRQTRDRPQRRLLLHTQPTDLRDRRRSSSTSGGPVANPARTGSSSRLPGRRLVHSRRSNRRHRPRRRRRPRSGPHRRLLPALPRHNLPPAAAGQPRTHTPLLQDLQIDAVRPQRPLGRGDPAPSRLLQRLQPSPRQGQRGPGPTSHRLVPRRLQLLQPLLDIRQFVPRLKTPPEQNAHRLIRGQRLPTRRHRSKQPTHIPRIPRSKTLGLRTSLETPEQLCQCPHSGRQPAQSLSETAVTGAEALRVTEVQLQPLHGPAHVVAQGAPPAGRA